MKIVQIPRHTTGAINAIVLPAGNMRQDSVTKEIRIGDGLTAGGHRILTLDQNNALFIRKDEGLGPEVGFPEAGIGIMVRLVDDTYVVRLLTVGDGIIVDNGDGASGDPEFSIDQTYLDAWLAAMYAADTDIWGNVAEKIVRVQEAFESYAHVTLTDAATVAINLGAGINFKLSAAGNRALGNPTGINKVQTGEIEILASGAQRSITFGANWNLGAVVSPVVIPSGQRASVIYGINSAGEPNIYSSILFS